MTLATGTKLGSYEVVAQIGAGGMGEVYQAHDTRLIRRFATMQPALPGRSEDRRRSRYSLEA